MDLRPLPLCALGLRLVALGLLIFKMRTGLFLLGLVGAVGKNALNSKEPVSQLTRAGLATGDVEGPSFLALLLNLRTYAVGLAFSCLGPILALVNDPVWNSSSFHPASALQISASAAD